MTGQRGELPSGAVGAVIDAQDRVRGTAFWVAPTLAVSCYHVVSLCGDGPIRVVPFMADTPVEVVSVDPDPALDLVVLRTAAVPPGVGFLGLGVGRSVGEVVVSHGYPIDHRGATWPKGHPMDPAKVSGFTILRHNNIDGQVMVLADAFPGPGQSGGPAFSVASGTVIGVLRIRVETSTDAGELHRAYAVPAGVLVERWPELRSYVSEVVPDRGRSEVPPSQRLPPVGLPPPARLIRSDRSERLAGRDEQLNAIATALSAHQTAAVVTTNTGADPAGQPPPAAGGGGGSATLHGWAGVGKSALAIEYCYQHLDRYSVVWFVNAESALTIAAAYRQFAGEIGLDTVGVEDPTVVQHVNGHLTRRQDWLAVFDNAEDRASIEGWLPPASHGHLLITSRNPARWDQPITIDKLSVEATQAWLLDATGTPSVDPTDEDRRVAGELAVELDGLPLAIAQAIAYIDDLGTPPAAYLELFRSEQQQLLNSTQVPLGYPNNVATTINLAADALTAAGHHHALRLLALIAYLAPDRIPVDLFTPHILGAGTNNDLETAIGALRRYGLITRAGNELWVHRLTQAVTRDNPPPPWQPTPPTPSPTP